MYYISSCRLVIVSCHFILVWRTLPFLIGQIGSYQILSLFVYLGKCSSYISTSFLKYSFPRYGVFCWHSYFSALWIYHSTTFGPTWFLMRSQLLFLLRILCMWWLVFFLLLQDSLLSLTFSNLNMMCPGVVVFESVLLRHHWTSGTFIIFNKFSYIISLNIPSTHSFVSFLSLNYYYIYVCMLDCDPKVSKLWFVSYSFFFFFWSSECIISNDLPLSSLILYSTRSNLLLRPILIVFPHFSYTFQVQKFYLILFHFLSFYWYFLFGKTIFSYL